ncbi:MAG: type II toxin-antitoxin system HicA family toxin [Deltaproteobacteria bacterium]|nr:type II toxin-antitoxin system HicA family toxin [Deltaproteobacteria bacterium]
MSKLPQITGKICVKALKRAGFYIDRQKGSHVIMLKDNPRLRACVPMHGEIKKGTLHQLLMDSGLSVDDFLKLL